MILVLSSHFSQSDFLSTSKRSQTTAILLDRSMKKRTIQEATIQADPLALEIFQAIRHCQYQRLSLYLRHKYNLNVTAKDGRNGLFFALDIDNPEKRARMLRFCLEHGIDALQKESVRGYTPLHETIDRQQADSFQILLDDVRGELDWRGLDNRGRTILHQAVESNNIAMLEALVLAMNRYKVSVDICDKNGLTPYLLAVKLHLPDMANLLLTKGRASRQQCDRQMHLTALQWQMAGIKEQQTSLKKKLRFDIVDAMKEGKINRVKQLKELYSSPLISFASDHYRRHSFLSTTTGSGYYHRPINEMLDQLIQGDVPETFVGSQTDVSSTKPAKSLPPLIPRPSFAPSMRRRHGRNEQYHSLTDLDQIGLLS